RRVPRLPALRRRLPAARDPGAEAARARRAQVVRGLRQVHPVLRQDLRLRDLHRGVPVERARPRARHLRARAGAEARAVRGDGQRGLETLQVFDELGLLPRAQVQAEYAVVVLDHVEQRREAPVVVEAALLVRPEALERRRAVALVWRALRLEVVDPDLFGG